MTLPDLREIAIAWVRAVNPSPEHQAIAESRLAICNSCEFKYWRGSYEEYTCRACGCPLLKKIYSPKRGPDACPHKKWVT